jgi:ribosomal protein S18 acetylase RimI-like enzyme
MNNLVNSASCSGNLSFEIQSENSPSIQDYEFLYSELAKSSPFPAESSNVSQFSFFIRDNQNQILGAIIGAIQLSCANIHILWVSPTIRNQKAGSQLVQHLEEHAKQLNCSLITVQTMNWEAPGFYEKLNYHLDFLRDGYSNNSKLCFYRKKI